MEITQDQNFIASFHSKGFRYPFWLSILVIMQMGMLAMFASFAIGVPVFMSVIFLLVAFTLGIGLIGGYTSYSLHKEGIEQVVKPFNWSPIKLRSLTRSFAWSDIKSYKTGSDLSRSMQRYNYLYISVRKMPYQLRLSDDQSDKEALRIFTEAFEKVLTKELVDQQPFYTLAADKNQPIKLLRKPDFYHTRFAHIIFWFFILAVSIIAWVMFTTNNLKERYLWRFSAVIVPGLGYMAYRLYGRGRQE